MKNHMRSINSVGVIFIILCLAGCTTSVTPSIPPPLSMQPLAKTPPPPHPLLPSPTVMPQNSISPASRFKLIKTVQVTPDDFFLSGGFLRLGYIPASDTIVAAFGSSKLTKSGKGCTESGHGYKVFTVDMLPTGKEGVLHCEPGADSAELFVDNILYDVAMVPAGKRGGWRIIKYDTTTWKELGRTTFAIDDQNMSDNDMMVEFVNGELDISSTYFGIGAASTHHNFFTPDLEFLNTRILADIENVTGSSMLFIDNTYLFVTSSKDKQVVVMKYNKDWEYIGMKKLLDNGIFAEGLGYDGQRFYIAYENITQSTEVGKLDQPNIHLAAFDRNWNLLEDLAVTHYTFADSIQAWRPWVLVQGNHLYVAYDVVPLDPANQKELVEQIQAYVVMYELPQKP
jgi:hypothetical protein